MVRSEQAYWGECEEGGLNIVHWKVRMTEATNGTPQEVPRISLTFDDGPHPIWTPRVLEALERAQTWATFFVVTPLARRFPYVISDILRYGHRVEFHCTEHVRHTKQSRKEVQADVRDGLRELRRQGVHPRFWRPPWGVLAPFTAEIAYAFELKLALWTVGTRDWQGDPATEMLERVGPDLRTGSIVLMHDGVGPGALRSGCSETVNLVGPLVEHIRSLGYEPGPLDTTYTAGTIPTDVASAEQEGTTGT
ncbi:MAG TPA: polysaccharide deacetylase family protein [Rubrobacteraceae bacterium]|jgi:peptidoglycan/xylan/chitin deacetylase (PgdA/CDA1 family)|nr:polysaccharide deacetylase family protein [Rubrobacteraceae bacterium]